MNNFIYKITKQDVELLENGKETRGDGMENER